MRRLFTYFAMLVAMVATLVGCTKESESGDYKCAVPNDAALVARFDANQMLAKSGLKAELTQLVRAQLQAEGAPEWAVGLADDFRHTGIDVEAPEGNMIIDIGGGTSEIACISLGGIVCSESIDVAGDVYTNDIVEYVRREHNVRIGERTAEQIKCKIGAAIPELEEAPEDFEFTGPDITTGLPRTISLSYGEIAYALEESLAKLDAALMKVLQDMPAELYSDVVRNGIYLAGGGALIKGLDRRLSRKTGIPFHIAEDPLRAVVRGTNIALKNINHFSFLMR